MTTAHQQTFAPGMDLSCRSICDHDCIYIAQIISRTDKTLTIRVQGKTKRCKIHRCDAGDEYIYPFGRHSMAPIMRPA